MPVVSVTMNPVLDLGGDVDQIIPNEKNYIKNETRFPGGNAINASRMISRLGVPTIATGFLGGGIGSEIRALLEKENIPTHFISIAGHSRIGITVSNLDSHLQTRLSFPGPWIKKEEFESLTNYLSSLPEGSLVVMGGSFPQGIDLVQVKEMLTLLRDKGIYHIIDVPGKALAQLIDSQPVLIKPNLVEFQDLVGKELTSKEEVIKAAVPFLQKVKLICISSVEGGALLLSKEGGWFGKIPPVEVRTTVGAGDSMVGVMCAKLNEWGIETDKTDELLRWGLAASCATLTTRGTQLGALESIQKYLSEVEIIKEVINS